MSKWKTTQLERNKIGFWAMQKSTTRKTVPQGQGAKQEQGESTGVAS